MFYHLNVSSDQNHSKPRPEEKKSSLEGKLLATACASLELKWFRSCSSRTSAMDDDLVWKPRKPMANWRIQKASALVNCVSLLFSVDLHCMATEASFRFWSNPWVLKNGEKWMFLLQMTIWPSDHLVGCPTCHDLRPQRGQVESDLWG